MNISQMGCWSTTVSTLLGIYLESCKINLKVIQKCLVTSHSLRVVRGFNKWKMEKLKAQDLRIGNLYESMGREFTLDMKMMYTFCSGSLHYNIDDIKGIPLTEEWLLKFGFHVDFRDEACVSFIHNKLDCDAIILDVYKKDFYFNTWEQSKAPQSVHQLQNLFYALTGEELECK